MDKIKEVNTDNAPGNVKPGEDRYWIKKKVQILEEFIKNENEENEVQLIINNAL